MNWTNSKSTGGIIVVGDDIDGLIMMVIVMMVGCSIAMPTDAVLALNKKNSQKPLFQLSRWCLRKFTPSQRYFGQI